MSALGLLVWGIQFQSQRLQRFVADACGQRNPSSSKDSNLQTFFEQGLQCTKP